MKKEQFYKILGDINEQVIKEAERPPVKQTKIKSIGYSLGAVACIVLICIIGIVYQRSNSPINSNSSLYAPTSSESDVALEYKSIEIYYLKNNEIISTSEYLPCSPKDIFNCWKAYNKIGDEVQLIGVKIENNGTESVDSMTAAYSAGDIFKINVTVTKNLQNYYGILPEEKLLDSLKQTLTGYSEIAFNEYHLVFE